MLGRFQRAWPIAAIPLIAFVMVLANRTGASSVAVAAASVPMRPVARTLPRADAGGNTRIACIGDSIANYACTLASNSFISHAVFKKNRSWFFEPNDGDPNIPASGGNFSVVGSHSGTGNCPSDMNCPARLAALAAFNPDILFVQVGRNEGGTGSLATVENIKAAVDAVLKHQPSNRLRAVIVVPVLPGGVNTPIGPMSPEQVAATRQMHEALLRLARMDPLYHVFDAAARFTDPNARIYAPIGGYAGDAGAVLMDGVHPSQFGARLVADEFNRLLDSLDVKALSPKPLARSDIFDMRKAPEGNLVGEDYGVSDGAFSHASGSVGVGGAGQAPAGFKIWSDHPELTWRGTVKQSLGGSGTELSRSGYRLTVSSDRSLRADRAVSLELLVPGEALRSGNIYSLGMHARISAIPLDSCNGLTNIGLQFFFPETATNWIRYSQDSRPTSTATGSDLLNLTADEDRDYQIAAMTVRQVPISAAHLLITVQFKQGSRPLGCVVYLSDLALRTVH